MGWVPTPESARGVLAAAVIAVTAMTAACGNVQPGEGGGGAGAQPSARSGMAVRCTATPAARDRVVTFTKRDNGTVACIARGATVAVYLQGTPALRWAPIKTASPALVAAPNGRLTLRLGVTGAFFKAVKRGVAVVTSSLANCPVRKAGSGTTGPAGAPCTTGAAFRLTLVVQ